LTESSARSPNRALGSPMVWSIDWLGLSIWILL